jgi:uncharacterized protein YjbI with pentapeptide repeats
MALTERTVIDSKNGFELQDLRNEQIHMACFKESEFHGIDMRDTSFAHTNFVNAKWEHIYFSNVQINWIQMGGTIFENIVRPEGKESKFEEEPGTDGWINLEPVQFKNSDLSQAVFEFCDLSNVELKNCNIDGLRVDGIFIKDLLEHYKRNYRV